MKPQTVNGGAFSSAFLTVQYVVLGPRVKIIILTILTELKRRELNFSLKIAFMFLFNFRVVSSKLKYFSCNSKKGDRARGRLVRECGPWSANHVNRTKSTCESQNFHTRIKLLTIFYLFFLILGIS